MLVAADFYFQFSRGILNADNIFRQQSWPSRLVGRTAHGRCADIGDLD
jgi:hypothetical protein